MKPRHAAGASHTRVSPEQRAEDDTIAGTLDTLKSRVEQDGLALDPEQFFIGEGDGGIIPRNLPTLEFDRWCASGRPHLPTRSLGPDD